MGIIVLCSPLQAQFLVSGSLEMEYLWVGK